MPTELEALRERYDTLLHIYTEAATRSRAALGEVKPLGNGPVPMIPNEWVEAVEEERRIEPEYIAARDAYWNAVSRQRDR